MKQMFLYTLIIFTFHLTVLLIPMVVFIISLSLPGVSLFHTLHWFYFPLAILSPVLIFILSYRIAHEQPNRPWMAVFCGFTGFSPIWLAYLSLTAPWNPRDLGILLFSPIFLGLIAIIMVKLADKNPR